MKLNKAVLPQAATWITHLQGSLRFFATDGMLLFGQGA